MKKREGRLLSPQSRRTEAGCFLSQVFAYLLQQGADANIKTFEGCFDASQVSFAWPAEFIRLLMRECVSVYDHQEYVVLIMAVSIIFDPGRRLGFISLFVNA